MIISFLPAAAAAVGWNIFSYVLVAVEGLVVLFLVLTAALVIVIVIVATLILVLVLLGESQGMQQRGCVCTGILLVCPSPHPLTPLLLLQQVLGQQVAAV